MFQPTHDLFEALILVDEVFPEDWPKRFNRHVRVGLFDGQGETAVLILKQPRFRGGRWFQKAEHGDKLRVSHCFSWLTQC